MQTTIFRKIDKKTMNKMFDDGKIYIKYFRLVADNYYQIDIRHGEEESPETLFDNELKLLKTNKIKKQCIK
jgi:hypothetical protein